MGHRTPTSGRGCGQATQTESVLLLPSTVAVPRWFQATYICSVPVRGESVSFVIDGENLRRSIDRHFAKAIHPALLVRELAQRRRVVRVHYVSGRFHNTSGSGDRRRDLLGHTGITLDERPLATKWEWMPTSPLPDLRANQPRPAEREARLKPTRTYTEKGVDVAIAMRTVVEALSGQADAVVVVSGDRDLAPVAQMMRDVSPTTAVESIYFRTGRRIGTWPDFDWTHQIDEAMVERCNDHFDYTQHLRFQGRDQWLALHGFEPWPVDD